MEWGVLTYILTVSSPRLSFGRLGDMFGNKNLFIAGMVSFTRGSEVGMITADLRVKRLQCAAGERFGEPHGIRGASFSLKPSPAARRARRWTTSARW
jgi:MFS family permease